MQMEGGWSVHNTFGVSVVNSVAAKSNTIEVNGDWFLNSTWMTSWIITCDVIQVSVSPDIQIRLKVIIKSPGSTSWLGSTPIEWVLPWLIVGVCLYPSVIWLWSFSFQDVLRLESSLTDMQRAYEAEVCARQALLAELEEQREVQKQLDGIRTWVRELQAAWVKEGNGNFSESFRLVMESVKNLQEAVAEVYKKAPHWTELKFVLYLVIPPEL